MRCAISRTALIFVNLVDFDQQFGHRNDVEGYAGALEAVDRWLPNLALEGCDLVVLTADHGCDPTTASTDHSREYTPLLVYGNRVRGGVNLGTRATLADIGQTVAENFGTSIPSGTSFLQEFKMRSRSMRRRVMAANWKMYKTARETAAFFEQFNGLWNGGTRCDVVVFPVSVNIPVAVEASRGNVNAHRRSKFVLGEGRRLYRRNFRRDASRSGRNLGSGGTQ